MLHLAEEFALSDRGLAKLCVRMEIPLPGRGYWRKVERGIRVKQLSLKEPSKKCLLRTHYFPGLVRNEKAIKEDPLVVEVQARESKAENLIVVPEEVGKYHPLVKKTLSALLSNKPDDYGRLHAGTGLLSISCSKQNARRAARIFHTLITGFEKRGYTVSVHPDFSWWHPNPTILHCEGERLILSLTERALQAVKERSEDKWYYSRREIYKASGELILKIDFLDHVHRSSKRTWVDKPGKSLEEQLNHFMIGLAKATVRARQAREESEREAARRAEERRHEEHLQKLWEEVQERVKNLGTMYTAWAESNRLREFLKQAKKTFRAAL